MAENIDELTIAFYQDERLVVKELAKVVLNKKTGEYEKPKVSIRRYQKRGGVYRQQSKFNISSAKQAREISHLLLKWFPDEAAGGEEAAAAEDSDD